MEEMVAELIGEEQIVIAIAEQYIKAFKEVNPKLINDFFAPECIKTGYFYDFENDKWRDRSIHCFEELKQWAAEYNLEGIMPNSTHTITLLDIQDKIAVVKIELKWAPRKWGCDYVFLSKDNGNWIITNILWQTII